ncbi:MAG: endonuclease V [Planctomycetales bacterium]|nr:endonuclease V [Planctomycetales bacterium]
MLSRQASQSPWPEKFELPDLPVLLGQLVQSIPQGHVTTYGDLARALGDVAASRWVGQHLADHVHENNCCCHRVVLATGKIGNYVTGNAKEKLVRLRDDGIRLEGDQVDLGSYRWIPPRGETPTPLELLRRLQLALASQVSLEPPTWAVSKSLATLRVAGIDASYCADGTGVASLVSMRDEQVPAEQRALELPVPFPYITGYLAFRELPLMATLIRSVPDEVSKLDVLVVDGSGILHPRACGIASMLGVLTGVTTIGVTKKHLCGQYDERELQTQGWGWVYGAQAELRGAVLLPPSGSARPLFVSPGHGIDVPGALRVIKRFYGRRRLPSPIFWADRFSRQQVRLRNADGAGATNTPGGS